MKTAIVKTDFWKQERIFELLPDTRYFYLCLLTNPERTSIQAFKCSDRLMVAYTGYTIDTIRLCQEELVRKGFIQLVDGYYILNDQDCIKPKKGKLSEKLCEKDFKNLPEKIQNLLGKCSGAAQDGISISNSNNINKSNNKYEKLFYELVEILGFTSAIKYSTGRRHKLEARLKTFTPDEIRKAATALSASAYHQGDNPAGKRYGTIDFLLRSDEKVDEWLNSDNVKTTYKADW